VLKILGANAIIAGVVFVLLGNGAAAAEEGAIVVIAAALAFAFAVNALLVRVALSPVRELERVAEAVSFGEFGSRAMPSLVADRQLAQLTDTVNRLLDSLAAERQRIQKLGAVVVSAQDMERARLSRELHDSIAQTIAAVRFQLSAAAAGTSDNAMSNRLSTARAMLGTVMDEVRNISNTLHPRVAEDLGLMRALDALAQRVEERGKLSVRIHSMLDDRPVSAKAATTLFRVAQEAVNEAETRTAASHAEIAVISNGGTVSLEVRDDRPPVDMESIQPDNTRSGALARILDRVELSGGVMRIERGASGGMRIIAEVDSSEDDS
jgi:signal transduction histidine kinase